MARGRRLLARQAPGPGAAGRLATATTTQPPAPQPQGPRGALESVESVEAEGGVSAAEAAVASGGKGGVSVGVPVLYLVSDPAAVCLLLPPLHALQRCLFAGVARASVVVLWVR
eukprot:COSAG01_NODE_1731_length_9369_cov_35.048220_8_plen_114_part_00